jgi:hypothetical protein
MQHIPDARERRKRVSEILCAVAISVLVLVTYFPITEAGFFHEDHVVLDEVVRLAFPEYLRYEMGQCTIASFCRPAENLGIWVEYALFGNNARAFRVVEILIHLANCLLLYGLVRRVSKKTIVGVIAAMIYAGLPVVTTTFPWLGSADPGVSFFYLAAIALWLAYLEHGRAWAYVLAVAAAVLGLLNKEIGATIPVALFLADRWLDGKPIKSLQLIQRYLPLALIWGFYGWFTVQRMSAFTSAQYRGNYAGLAISQVLPNLVSYGRVLASVWQTDIPVDYVLLVFVVFVLIYLGVRRNYQALFVCSVAFLSLVPVLPFSFVAVRFLYLPMMGSAILLAGLLVAAHGAVANRQAASMIGAALVSALVLWNAFAAAETFDGLAAYTRQYRAPLRPLFQRYPDLPEDTYLYFLDSPIPTRILSGMIALRYGKGVTVGSTEISAPAELRKHSQAYVCYFDEQNHLIAQVVEQTTRALLEPTPPVDFSVPLRLEGYEVARADVKRGEALAVVLYWRATAPIAQPYTVFAHLTDAKGEMIAGVDGEPRGGKSPTNTWQPGALVVDWVVVPISADSPMGEYRLEIGWYYLPTLERMSAFDALGNATDKIVIQPFVVE